MKIAKLYPSDEAEFGVVGEVIDFYWDRDNTVLFRVVWYGRPGIDTVRADQVEVVR